LAQNDSAVDASEFDAFDDVVNSDQWQAVSAEGTMVPVAQAPVFVEDEVTWRSR
jgi:hypothetical protein